MKTKKLIELLNEADPTGEEDVCVGNVDIHFIETLPAYYDGSAQVLIRDENSRYYNIIGAKYKRSGHKVQIHTLSITDAISNESKKRPLEVDYSQLGEYRAESTKKAHADLRQWHVDLENQMELEYFIKWAKEKAELVTSDTEDIDSLAKAFYDRQKIGPYDGPLEAGHSYVSMRASHWDKAYKVVVTEGFLEITSVLNK